MIENLYSGPEKTYKRPLADTPLPLSSGEDPTADDAGLYEGAYPITEHVLHHLGRAVELGFVSEATFAAVMAEHAPTPEQ
jgi:hypothetical protein